IKTCGGALKAIRDKSIPDDVEDYILSGILFETIKTANTLLQREQVNIILDVERANPLVFRQHPELRDVVCTACQTGEFGGVVDLDIFQKAEPGSSSDLEYPQLDSRREDVGIFDRSTHASLT
ncbi:hypothetical protein M405DRAFT_805457, partial [Rhizopogon salebrosus TDB-379]